MICVFRYSFSLITDRNIQEKDTSNSTSTDTSENTRLSGLDANLNPLKFGLLNQLLQKNLSSIKNVLISQNRTRNEKDVNEVFNNLTNINQNQSKSNRIATISM